MPNSTPKWTPGPWDMGPSCPVKLGGVQEIPCFEISGRLDACWVALVQEHRNCIATHGDANARLIAAATDLYAALEALPLDSFDKDMDTIDAAEFVDNAGAFFTAMQKARAAMAKARGESDAK